MKAVVVSYRSAYIFNLMVEYALESNTFGPSLFRALDANESATTRLIFRTIHSYNNNCQVLSIYAGRERFVFTYRQSKGSGTLWC